MLLKNDEVVHLHLNGLVYTHLSGAIGEVKHLPVCEVCVARTATESVTSVEGKVFFTVIGVKFTSKLDDVEKERWGGDSEMRVNEGCITWTHKTPLCVYVWMDWRPGKGCILPLSPLG